MSTLDRLQKAIGLQEQKKMEGKHISMLETANRRAARLLVSRYRHLLREFQDLPLKLNCSG